MDAQMRRELIKQVNDEARRVAILRTKMQAVETWNQRRGLSNSLRKQIRTYFAKVWLDHNGGVSAPVQDTCLTRLHGCHNGAPCAG